jgi:4-hydroxybenzoate polyprenyltransferase
MAGGPMSFRFDIGMIVTMRGNKMRNVKSDSRTQVFIHSALGHHLNLGYLVLREARISVQLVVLLRLLVGIAQRGTIDSTTLPVTAGLLCLTTAAYVFNGVMDIDGDRANGSTRPIASGRLPVGAARRAVAFLVVAGLAGCATGGRWTLAAGAAVALWGYTYSAGPTLKTGTLRAGLSAVPIIGLTYAVGCDFHPRHPLSLLFCFGIAVWIAMSCGVKDFSDMFGDYVSGRTTWPILLGPQRAAQLIGALSVGCAVVLVVLGSASPAVQAPALVLLAGSLALAGSLKLGSQTPEKTLGRRPYRVFMLTQYSTNITVLGTALLF